jgi:hypothetical protein
MDCSPAAVAAFMARFERGAVTKEEWTHQAHLVAGYWYVEHLGADQAIEALRKRIRFHNECIGTANTDSGGYHESITRLFVYGIAALRAQQPARNLEEGLNALLASPMNASAWPLQFYSRERLSSVAARRRWVEPDLKPCR